MAATGRVAIAAVLAAAALPHAARAQNSDPFDFTGFVGLRLADGTAAAGTSTNRFVTLQVRVGWAAPESRGRRSARAPPATAAGRAPAGVGLPHSLPPRAASKERGGGATRAPVAIESRPARAHTREPRCAHPRPRPPALPARPPVPPPPTVRVH
jgi:hypothetical protein